MGPLLRPQNAHLRVHILFSVLIICFVEVGAKCDEEEALLRNGIDREVKRREEAAEKVVSNANEREVVDEPGLAAGADDFISCAAAT